MPFTDITDRILLPDKLAKADLVVMKSGVHITKGALARMKRAGVRGLGAESGCYLKFWISADSQVIGFRVIPGGWGQPNAVAGGVQSNHNFRIVSPALSRKLLGGNSRLGYSLTEIQSNGFDAVFQLSGSHKEASAIEDVVMHNGVPLSGVLL